jgi:hypothetical protein
MSHVCRDHPDQPVNWRGHGCQACEDEHKGKRRSPIEADWILADALAAMND